MIYVRLYRNIFSQNNIKHSRALVRASKIRREMWMLACTCVCVCVYVCVIICASLYKLTLVCVCNTSNTTNQKTLTQVSTLTCTFFCSFPESTLRVRASWISQKHTHTHISAARKSNSLWSKDSKIPNFAEFHKSMSGFIPAPFHWDHFSRVNLTNMME